MVYSTAFVMAALLGLVNGHAAIIGAVGENGSPTSVGFAVDPNLARNCTSISPCQQDATLIRDAEIAANIVNSCGRTEIGGNIDVGENTENALAAGAVTQVKKGTELTVTIHQVNADGAGPFFCDLDSTSNTGAISHNLTVTNNVPGSNGFSQAKTQAFEIKVQMPDDFTCIGGSTGNICTVRCRNNALAGPFGGCFAVQQTDVTPNVNVPDQINTIKQLGTVLSQQQQNVADFQVANDANNNAGSDAAKAAQKAVDDILAKTPIATAVFPQETPTLVNNPDAVPAPIGGGGAAADPAAPVSSAISPDPATPTQDAGNGNGNGNGRNGRNGRNRGNNQQNQNAGNNQKRSGLRWANRN